MISVVHAVIFDIGNVLLKFDFQHVLRELGEAGPSLLQGSEKWRELKLRYESGRTPRAAFVEEAIQMTGFQLDPANFCRLWQEIFSLNEPMWEVVRELSGRVPLFLLSNTNDLHVEYITRQYPGFGVFNDAVYSHEVGLMKPDPAIFQHAIQRFGVEPNTTVFIDDLPDNIQAARECGLQAITYSPDRHAHFLTEFRAVASAISPER